MREQAKKMNVQSLRAEENQNISVEAKLAKVRRKKKYIKILNILYYKYIKY